MTIQIGKPYNLYELIQKADAGDYEAMFDVVMAIDIDGLMDDDPDGEIAERRLSYLKQLVNVKGYENSLITLATTYENGNGIKQDAKEAIRWYQKAVEAGIPFGNECIGEIYYKGKGIPADYEKAYRYFTKDNVKKSPSTIYFLSEMYRKGLYVEKDEETACHLYAEIVEDTFQYAELDDYYWRACYRLGVAKHYGRGTEKDIDVAVRLLTKAKSLFDNLDVSCKPKDITKDELYHEWLMLNQDAGKY